MKSSEIGNKIANKNNSILILLTATHQKRQKIVKGDINQYDVDI